MERLADGNHLKTDAFASVMHDIKHVITAVGSVLILLATGYVKGSWRYSEDLKQLLAKHWTMLTCDTRGVIYQGSTAFDLEETDIFVATFGRSGTMFSMNLLHQMRSGGDRDFEAVEFLGRFFVPMSGVGLGTSGPEKPELLLRFARQVRAIFTPDLGPSWPGNPELLPRFARCQKYSEGRERLNWPQRYAPPRLFFTHGLPQQVPQANYVIFIQRDPKEILTSWYLFQMQMYGFQNISIEDYYFNCLRKHCVWPQDSLFLNLQQWWLRRGTDNILWLRFEDFKKSVKGTFALATKIQKFLGGIHKMQRNISTIFDNIVYSFSKSRPHQFDLHSYNDYLDESLDLCASHRPDLTVIRSHRGIKSAHQLNITIKMTQTVLRHMHYTWQRLLYPVTSYRNYTRMLTRC